MNNNENRQGKMDRKIYTAGIKNDSRFGRWFDNYWYHYKWLTLGVIFVVFVIIVCSVQFAGKEKEDTTVLYAGERALSARENESICAVINEIMPRDFDGDGKKNTGLVNYWILSEEQIKEAEAQTDEKGFKMDVNNQLITNNYEQYYDYLLTGESAVCFVDRHLYGVLTREKRVLPLVEVLGKDSGYEEDDYGLLLRSTALYEDYSAIRAMGDETVICFLRQTTFGRVNDDEVYENEKELFCALVNYGKEN